MNRILFLTIILICCFSTNTAAQFEKVKSKEVVGFGCYSEGRFTEPVIKVTNLLKTKKYKKISKLLNSRNKGKKYLAIISLQKLAEIGQYNLSDTERDLISNAKQSDELVSVCSGCTYFDKIPMKTILSKKDLIGSSYWLDETIKQE